jgi:3-oxoacyl-[acyl-carrier-protein] synthase-3
MSRYATIIGTGRYLPDIEVSNDELRRRFAHLPEFVDKMEASTNIKTRWRAPDDWATSDLAVRAAERALVKAGRRPGDVDLIILGTDSPDYITPATSVVVQHSARREERRHRSTSAARAPVSDGPRLGPGLIATNAALKTVVVIGVCMMRKLADPNDPTVFFYGDGARRRSAPRRCARFIGAAMQADGSFHKNWGIYWAPCMSATEESVRAGRTTVKLSSNGIRPR